MTTTLTAEEYCEGSELTVKEYRENERTVRL